MKTVKVLGAAILVVIVTVGLTLAPLVMLVLMREQWRADIREWREEKLKERDPAKR